MVPFAYQMCQYSTAIGDEKLLTRIHIGVFPLHTHEIYDEDGNGQCQAECAAPPNDRCTKEVIFALVVAPSTHTQTKSQEWPISRLGGQYVVFVRVRNQGVIGSHHSHVEMPEIAHE